jgi:DNA replication and repair protein RecF
MIFISTLSLQNFRNFSKKQFKFAEPITVMVGANAAGKTNTLEAIYLLASGKSFRAGQEEEMIKEDEEVARVESEATIGGSTSHLEVVLTRGSLNGTKVPRKRLSINGVPKRLYNFVGSLKAVLFGPQDLELVTGSPSNRRRFLDGVLSQTDREYHRSLLSYEKGVRQRNKVLERVKEGAANRSQLLFWDKLVIKNGTYLTRKREEFIDFVNSTNSPGEESFSLDYHKSVISEARLAQYAREEVLACATLVGPHRDDVAFKIQTPNDKFPKKKDLAAYGSRGEQRMGVLWLKLAELEFITKAAGGERPLLLLDDVFSELDQKHHKVVMNAVEKQQTIITTADEHSVERWYQKVRIIRL